MRSTLLFWRHFGVIALTYLALAFVFVTVVAQRERTLVTDAVLERQHDVALSIRAKLSDDDEVMESATLDPTIDALGAEIGSRVTLIAYDGTVIADSQNDPARMNNHADRPEIAAARETGYGQSLRYSGTLKTDMWYVCVGPRRIDATPDELSKADTTLVRVSVNAHIIDARVSEVQRFLWFFAIAVASVAGTVTWILSMRAMQPIRKITDAANAIAKGDYETSVSVDGRQADWGTVALAFERMQDELRRREHDLIENANRLETVLGSMSEGVIALNREGRIEFSNRAAQAMLRIPDDHVAGRSLMEIVRLPVVRDAVNDAWTSKTPIRCEFETRGNYRRTMMMRIARMELDRGIGLVIVLHDVTELRQLETMRRDFVANVSHELKTPLASIKAYAETLKLGAINDANRNIEFVDQIESQADRLHELIMDLIQLARVESSPSIFEMTEVNVPELIEESVKVFAPLAASRDVKLNLECKAHVRIEADPEGLRTILDNLISNALRYTPADGEVTIRCSEENDEAVIDVIDTGVGIALEHQQRVFERFYRVDKARSADLGGTGLGLAIVKHMTHSFQGRVSLTSKVGRGSTFTVRFPLVKESVVHDAEAGN